MENCDVAQSCSWILTAACFSGDNVSLWTGARSSSLGDNFWISLTALRLFCYSHFVIRQDHGFGSPYEPHQSPGWLSFLLSCFYKSNSSYLFCTVICSALVICSVNCDYAGCWQRLARFWQMLTDFHGRANQSFALWEQRIRSKAWTLSVVPHFLSHRRVSPFSLGALAPLPLRNNGDYS